MEENKVSNIKFIRNILITLIALGITAVIFLIAPDYIIPRQDQHIGTTLIINNRDVTGTNRMKNEVIMEDNVVYISETDIRKFFDKYLYYDNNYELYVTTSEDKTASIKMGESKITINGITKDIKGRIIQKGNENYLPISDMGEVYNINIQIIENTNTILIDSLDREQMQAQTTKNINVKVKAKSNSRTIENIDENTSVIYLSSDNEWAKIRTENGHIGYVKERDLKNKTTIRENKNEESNSLEKISLAWDYYLSYEDIPNRKGTTIDGINVIAPSFFELKKLGKGDITDKAVNSKEYIDWAKKNNYKIWATVSNEALIETTSEILNDFDLRTKLISRIVNLVNKYELDGINIDFENMYKSDKDMFSRFIIELYPRLKNIGATLAVNITAPDGGDTWSLCYDRNLIANNCDYIIFMAFDQYSVGSPKAGTTAGYNWVEKNISKFLGQEGVEKNKLIVGVALYSRLWTEDGNEKPQSIIVNMNELASQVLQNGQGQWDDRLRQYYLEYEENGQTKKIWIEDLKSIREKLLLIKDYNLCGVAFWSLDRQDNSLWNEVNNIILNK